MTAIDQNTLRRIGRTGLTAHDPNRTCPGYLLYAPVAGDGALYALDMEGREVHRWDMPHPPGLWGYLLPNGNIFYSGKIKHDETWDRLPGWNAFKGGVMMEVDWEGKVVWEHRDINHHHDSRRTEAGGAIYLTIEPIPHELAREIQGGIHKPDPEPMWADVIVEVDNGGNRIWEWHAAEHLDPQVDKLSFNDHRAEWTHGNTVVPLSKNRILLSFRNLSTIGILSKETGDFEWKFGPGILAQQHDPTLLENGNILVFDNGAHRSDDPLTFSRVLEINPKNNEIIWSYQDRTPFHFFSPFVSGARRLPNGNTLITEGFFGRMFQVAPEGEVVWEYVNPHFHMSDRGYLTNGVFRATHIPPGTVSQLP